MNKPADLPFDETYVINKYYLFLLKHIACISYQIDQFHQTTKAVLITFFLKVLRHLHNFHIKE